MHIDLDDARLLLNRAKKHIQEITDLFGRQSPAPVWSIECRQDTHGKFVYSLRIHRAKLREVKPVMADAANNLVHSLDHVAAACARFANTGRSKNLYFPLADDDAKFAKFEREVRPLVGALYMDLFAKLRTQNRGPFHPNRYSYLALMREMARDNKHWNLSLAHSRANAIAWALPGAPRQTIVEIPEAHFETSEEFEFWKTAEPAPAGMGFSILVGLTLKGFASFPDASIDSAFEEAARLVEEVIMETEGAAANTP
ncbi:hypothetical protein ACVILI_000493 [Mesorhizobium sp. USDA 4775]